MKEKQPNQVDWLTIEELSEAKLRLVKVVSGMSLDPEYTTQEAVAGILEAIFFIDQTVSANLKM
ncbi:hypothetical protein [Gorillibacterium timonense]|uniref:hypothetical protein n=1 Tax=Gorillibacterium timonense TaxID=1689269 RepID=UPI00071D754A|nr:hypothetical protein [Gorillibacterium timonense]